MRLKRVNEFFDTDELKGKYEIPYLKGEMGSEISKFKNIPLIKDVSESTQKFFENILTEYPIFEGFKCKVQKIDDIEMVSLWATSYEPIKENGYELEFYAQLSIYHTDGYYGVNIVLRNLFETDVNKFQIYQYEVENIKEAFEIIDSFMSACEKLNIIKPEDKFSIKRN